MKTALKLSEAQNSSRLSEALHLASLWHSQFTRTALPKRSPQASNTHHIATMATLNDKALEFLQRTPTSSKDRVFPEDLNEHALQKLNCTPAAITDPVFSESVEEMSRRVKFVCSSPPGAPRTLRGAAATPVSPLLGKRRLDRSPPRSPDALGVRLPSVVTPDNKPRDWARDVEAPPALDLDGSPRAKRVKFYSSLAAVKEEAPEAAPHCATCGGATAPCRGKAFERSDLDYFEPCAGHVCLRCDAPACAECGGDVQALPFCAACLEMVQHEAGSFVAHVQPYSRYLCKGGGDDCKCNAIICDGCHAKHERGAELADLGLDGTRYLTDDDELKYCLQEEVTDDTRLCGDCFDRVRDVAKARLAA